MLSDVNTYDLQMLDAIALGKISEREIGEELERYLKGYAGCFVRSRQIKYFEAFGRGLLSGLDRKSTEPIALHFLGEDQVRGTRRFFKRSKGWEESAEQCYQRKLSEQIANEEGFQERKSYLGMTHYETRSYPAWHRHMLFVMIAHLFITVLRCALKKQCFSHHANDPLSHCRYDLPFVLLAY